MSASSVEQYEQILAQDPTSPVFVELARALIEQGEHSRAAQVCKSGVEHHDKSMVGRVLWGKALIHMGRPAEAMEQFDKAIAVDRDNPQAYNLIGEVLINKGLYRSAIPMLKKSVALRPQDGRVKLLLEQTEAAMKGGPPPVLSDFHPFDAQDGDGVNGEPPLASDAQPTQILQAYRPGEEESAPNAAAVTDPFAHVPDRPEANVTLPGLTRTFDALADGPDVPSEPTVIPSPELAAEEPRTEVQRGPPVLYPVGSPSGPPVLYPVAQAASAPPKSDEPMPLSTGDLLDEVISIQDEIQTSEQSPPAPGPPPVVAAPGKGYASLLDDIPDDVEPTMAVEIPQQPQVSRKAAEEIAQEYERELKYKLAAKAAEKTFLQKHGLQLAIGAIGIAVAISVVGMLALLKKRHPVGDLPTAIAAAKQAATQDTPDKYREALDALAQAVDMDEKHREAWALTAYARAILYAEHGRQPEDREKGIAALNRPGVRDDRPALALVAHHYLAAGDEKQQAEQKQEVLSSALDDSEVHELKGRLLLADKQIEKGLKELELAISLPSLVSVRGLVALGQYYLDFGDYESALDVFSRAGEISKLHPDRALGAARARLALGRELAESMEELEGLKALQALSVEKAGQRDLMRARVLAAVGKGDAAVAAVEEAASRMRGARFDLEMARGEARRSAGHMAEAQKAFEAALQLEPKSDEAKTALGRTLIARDREREALKVLVGDGDAKRLALIRGMAHAQLGEWKKAREELLRTGAKGKYPAEAVVYLALADAADGNRELAEKNLEKAVNAAKRARADVRVALGQLYWQGGAPQKAKPQFEEAAKDPLDVEGNCGLGRLLMLEGKVQEAIEPLERAVKRNGSHGEARHALGRAYLHVGRLDEGLQQAEAWQLDNPGAAAAQRDHALALYLNGRMKDAEAAAGRAVKLEGGNAEGHRIRAMAQFARDNGRGAFQSLEQSNKLNAKDAATFCEIGRAFWRQSDERAEGAYAAALREDPKSTCGVVGSVWVRLPSGAKAAVKELQPLSKSAPSWDRAWALAAMARAQLALGSVREARRLADEAASLGPASSEVHWVLGQVAQKERNEDKALEALRRAVELDPSSAPARLTLADALAQGGTEELVKESVAQYEAFLRRGGSDREVTRVKKLIPTLKKKLAKR